jgi:hypothetical protein
MRNLSTVPPTIELLGLGATNLQKFANLMKSASVVPFHHMEKYQPGGSVFERRPKKD